MAIPREPTATSHPDLHALIQRTPLTDREVEGKAISEQFRKSGQGYSAIHSTRPQTIGIPITDSPIGLLAWIYEKLHDWSDHAHYNWTDDEVLTWISIYYFSRPGPAASMRIYYEEVQREDRGSFRVAADYCDVPLGIAHFPRELAMWPKLWHRTMGPIVHESEWDYGGHFPSWERPEAIVKDLREMFGKGGGAEGVVGGGRNGYEK